jgi:hypothetical protein
LFMEVSFRVGLIDGSMKRPAGALRLRRRVEVVPQTHGFVPKPLAGARGTPVLR